LSPLPAEETSSFGAAVACFHNAQCPQASRGTRKYLCVPDSAMKEMGNCLAEIELK
jgi:hypothetical protein